MFQNKSLWPDQISSSINLELIEGWPAARSRHLSRVMLLCVRFAVAVFKCAKPNRKIHKSTENKCINGMKGYDSSNQGSPHSKKYEQRGETEVTTNCVELYVPFSPTLWNYIPINQHQRCQNAKQKHIPRASFHRGRNLGTLNKSLDSRAAIIKYLWI